MTLVSLLRLSFRNLYRQRRRNGIMLIAISIAIAGVINLSAFIRGMQQSISQSAIDNLNGHIKLLHPQYLDDPSIEYAIAADLDLSGLFATHDEAGIAYRLVIPAVVLSEREFRGVTLFGVDPQEEHISIFKDFQFRGEPPQSVDFDGLLIGEELAKELRTDVGRKVVLTALDSTGEPLEVGYRIAAIYDGGAREFERTHVFIGRKHLQEQVKTTKVTEISILLSNDEVLDSVWRATQSRYPYLRIDTWMTASVFAAEMSALVDTMILIMTIIIMGSLVFGLVNTFVTAVMERMREFGLLRTIGMRSRYVLIQVVIESVLMMVMGLLTGFMLGLLIYSFYADGIDMSAFTAGMEMMDAGSQLDPDLLLSDAINIALICVILGVFASIYPALRALKVPPLEASKR